MDHRFITTARDWGRRYKIEIFLFAIAFGIRFAYAIAIQIFYGSDGFSAYSDAESYLTVARNFLSHGSISESLEAPFVPDSLRTPLFPFFLALFLWLKIPFLGIVAVHNIFAGLSAVLVYRIGKTVFDSRAVGIVTALFVAIEPLSIYWNNLLMADNLFSFLFLLAVYLFIRRNLYVSFIVLGLSALTRPIGLYFFPLFLGMAIFRHYRDWGVGWGSTMAMLKTAALAVFLLLAIVSPWMVRNKAVFDTWSLSSAGWVNLYAFEAHTFAERHSLEFPEPARYSYDFENVPFYRGATLDLFFDYPFEYAKFHLIFSIKSFLNRGYDYLMDSVIRAEFPDFATRYGHTLLRAGNIFWGLIYAAIIVGFLWKPYRRWFLFLAALIVWNNLLQGALGVGQGGRYNLPTLPLLLLMGSCGFVFLFQWGMSRYHECGRSVVAEHRSS